MIFERKKYLDELIAGRGNGLVKIITGVRRCGKSFLLFDIWHNWLLEHGVTDSHIIEIQLDDFRNRRLRKPDALLDYIDSKVVDDGNPYYVVLDEVQLVEEFVEVIRRTRQTLWGAVQMLTQKHVAKRYIISQKVVPLHHETERQYKYV